MKTLKRRLASVSVLALALVASTQATGKNVASAQTAAPQMQQQQQQQYGALERGYRTGYSDGYQSGWGDSTVRTPVDYRDKEDYQRADRAYVASYGSLEDYRDGYRQGFEVGYRAGRSRRDFNSELPPGGVRRRSTSDNTANTRVAPADDADETASQTRANRDPLGGDSTSPATGAHVSIPSNTTLRVELLNRLSTDVSQRGDRFEARVLDPAEYAGAIVSGRVADVQRAGRARGRSQLQLDFDQIRLVNGDWMDFSAQVVEVIDTGADEQGEVDPEGGVRGKDSTKDDVAKVGASAGVGAIIGAIAGGGKGAAIGAIIGGAAGAGGVMTERGRDIRFERGQQLRIRTAGETHAGNN
ncbi:MAG TPA: hypothetical protein VGV59_17725 [Pyrinomonadaceae bacterium]|nr:hypothetical protein [Pyrinomonadaceae bacterium]